MNISPINLGFSPHTPPLPCYSQHEGSSSEVSPPDSEQAPSKSTAFKYSLKREKCWLGRKLLRQQYSDILTYLENNFSISEKLAKLQIYSGDHIPLLFSSAITLLEFSETITIEDIAEIILHAELRVIEDLAALGYSEPERESLSQIILKRHLYQIIAILSSSRNRSPTLPSQWSRLESAMLFCDLPPPPCERKRPRPIDWKSYYRIDGASKNVEIDQERVEELRQEAYDDFKYFKETLSEIEKICDSTPYLHSAIPTNLQRQTFSVTRKFFFIDILKSRREEIVEKKLEYMDSFTSSSPSATQAVIKMIEPLWKMENSDDKFKWLDSHSKSGHPLLAFEYAIALFEMNPTLAVFKRADKWISIGSLFMEMECQCVIDRSLLQLCREVEIVYRDILKKRCLSLCTEFERTKIDLWDGWYYKKRIERGIKGFNKYMPEIKKLPAPCWLFEQSQFYDFDKIYTYDEDTPFSFAAWRWPRLRRGYLNRVAMLAKEKYS